MLNIEPVEFISRPLNDWVKARKTKCDTALKDALSFISEKKEEHRPGARDAPMRSYPSHREPNRQQTKSTGDTMHPEYPP